MADPVLTAASTVTCSHQGTVKTQTASKLKVSGQAVRVAGAAPPTVSGCQWKPPPQTNTPCLNASPSAGTSTKLKVGGAFVLLGTLAGTTDSNPPGSISVSANQTKLKAN
jgi:hypothetical protein